LSHQTKLAGQDIFVQRFVLVANLDFTQTRATQQRNDGIDHLVEIAHGGKIDSVVWLTVNGELAPEIDRGNGFVTGLSPSQSDSVWRIADKEAGSRDFR